MSEQPREPTDASDLFRDSENPDPEAAFRRQKLAAVGACDAIAVAAFFLASHHDRRRVDEDLLRTSHDFVRVQEAHLRKYVRLPQIKSLPAIQRQLGSRIDRMLLASVALLKSAVELYELPEKLRVRREMNERSERRRQERLEARRHATPAPVAMSPPPVPVPKRVKQQPKPLCTKCGKRPQASGTLCVPCAQWTVRR